MQLLSGVTTFIGAKWNGVRNAGEYVVAVLWQRLLDHGDIKRFELSKYRREVEVLPRFIRI